MPKGLTWKGAEENAAVAVPADKKGEVEEDRQEHLLLEMTSSRQKGLLSFLAHRKRGMVQEILIVGRKK